MVAAMTDQPPLIRIQQAGASEPGLQPFDLTDRGLLLGDGVFDTSLVVGGHVVFLDAHLARLQADAGALGIETDMDTLRGFALAGVPEGAHGALRLTVTRGPGPRGVAPSPGLSPTLMSKFDHGPPAFPAEPVRLRSSGILRNPSAPSSRHKTLAYTDTIIGLDRARTAGFDDALYMTPDGHAACTSMANIFVRFGRTLVTPPLEDGVLDGITRRWLIDEAPAAGYQIEIESLNTMSLSQADAIYLTNSLQLIRAASRLDEIALDPALPEPLSEACKALLSAGR